MYQRTEQLQTPNDFNFPFTPYQIQQEFMSNLYATIEKKQIGIFESPTGTGKSLTLMCGALKWLQDHEAAYRKEIIDKIETLKIEIAAANHDTQANWLESQYGAIQKKEELCDIKNTLDLLDKYEQTFIELKKESKSKQERSKSSCNNNNKQNDNKKTEEEDMEENDNFMLDDLEDDEELEEESANKKYRATQIYFCSRTHSQLSQVVNEVKNTIYGKNIRIASLASRQNYCINASVLALKSSTLINERCIELQKNCNKSCLTAVDETNGTVRKKRKATATKCPYLQQGLIRNVRNEVLTQTMDIEELITLSKSEKACPYYASRMAAEDAQVVMLPYQMLLHKRTRKQSGIDLKNSILIIDEGHNLIDSVSSVYSAEVTLAQLQQAHQQLLSYKNKYFSRFSTKNLLKLNKFIFIVNRLIKMLTKPVQQEKNVMEGRSSSRMISVHDLMMEGEFFNIRLYEILNFCDATRLAHKIHGFAQKFGSVVLEQPVKTTEKVSYLQKLSQKVSSEKSKDTTPVIEEQSQKSEIKNNTDSDRSSVIRPLISFLDCLMEKSEDGRVLLSCSRDGIQSKASMKYLLLNPNGHFQDILDQCRSVIVAGGTMQPTADLKSQLFSSYSDRVKEYFFGHVVTKESILPLSVPKGPAGVPLKFTFDNRSNQNLLSELARTLQNVSQVVPAGIVCFFGSYDYMDNFYKFLQAHDKLNGIEQKKRVFKEPRSSNEMEKMLVAYGRAAKGATLEGCQTGALLFSVVGGKLSEGLNFSDDLGRCVIVVGLPFPNKNSPELVEKMQYLSNNYHNNAGTEYYENLCMKAVNQCIGRAVRHINDYASVLLLDERYNEERINKKLPQWIRNSLKCTNNFGMVQGSLAKFFREKKK